MWKLLTYGSIATLKEQGRDFTQNYVGNKKELRLILPDHKTAVSSPYYANNRERQIYTTEYTSYTIKAICIHCSACKS